MNGNKMVLPGADGTLSNVGSMNFGRRVLETCIVLSDECFHIMRGFVIQFVELWSVSPHTQVCIYLAVGTQEFRSVA